LELKQVEPDFLGWEVKQYAVDDFERIESSKPITLMTPEPDGGFYNEHEVEAFVRKFGYADKNDKPDRLNFGGRHFVGTACAATGLTMHLRGYDAAAGRITDAAGCFALVSAAGEVAAAWSFGKVLEHWSHKHTKAVYVPSNLQKEPVRQYRYGHQVRLAQQTDALRLLKAMARGAVYYDPGIKLERASTAEPKSKKRSQFRVASRNIEHPTSNTEHRMKATPPHEPERRSPDRPVPDLVPQRADREIGAPSGSRAQGASVQLGKFFALPVFSRGEWISCGSCISRSTHPCPLGGERRRIESVFIRVIRG
jgi:hypothetical protein